jgi:hypothetical protein
VFPEIPPVPVSLSLPIPPTLETESPSLPCQRGNIAVNFAADNVKSVAP